MAKSHKTFWRGGTMSKFSAQITAVKDYLLKKWKQIAFFVSKAQKSYHEQKDNINLTVGIGLFAVFALSPVPLGSISFSDKNGTARIIELDFLMLAMAIAISLAFIFFLLSVFSTPKEEAQTTAADE